MEEYFTREIKRIRRELTDLKTTDQKSAGVVPTTTQTISVSIPLTLSSSDMASGTAHIKVVTGADALIMATLDSYYGDITQATNYPATTRGVQLLQDYLGEGIIVIRLVAEGNADDRSTLSGGGSVSITKQLTVRATEPFSLEQINA